MKRRKRDDVQREKERTAALNISCTLFGGLVTLLAGVAGWFGGCNAGGGRFGTGTSIPIPPHSGLALVAVLAGVAVTTAATIKMIRNKRGSNRQSEGIRR